MKCPVCKDVDLVMSERSGIEVDYCPSCRGIWLDRGELDKIIERSSSHGEAGGCCGGSHHHESSHQHKDSYKKHKRKSFLSDIFDFD